MTTGPSVPGPAARCIKRREFLEEEVAADSGQLLLESPDHLAVDLADAALGEAENLRKRVADLEQLAGDQALAIRYLKKNDRLK